MKAVRFARFGVPTEVADVAELPDPGVPGPGEVCIDVEVAPIEPADLYRAQGLEQFGAVPFIGGLEGMGRIVAVGTEVDHLRVGDRVLLPIALGSWQQRVRTSAQPLFPLPATADPLQIGQLSVNPPTASLLLREFVDLTAGDWLIHNAATSSVGRYLIQLAQHRGLHALSVVRRESAIDLLRAVGSDVVLVDGPDLAQRVSVETGQAPIKLALDAVAGEATMRLAACLADGGTLVNYDMLSQQPVQIPPSELLFRDLRLRGFFLARWIATATPGAIGTLYQTLIPLVVDGTLRSEVEATYPLDRVQEALAHTMRAGRNGRILLTPGGSIG